MPVVVRYYRARSGVSDVREFLDQLNPKARAKCLAYLALLGERGGRLPENYAKHIRGRIWELRPEFGGVEYRLLYARIAGGFVVLHAFTKKRRQTPSRELERAERRLAEFEERSSAGDR